MFPMLDGIAVVCLSGAVSCRQRRSTASLLLGTPLPLSPIVSAVSFGPEDPQVRFRRALERRDVAESVCWARTLAPLGLLEALALVDLLAEQHDPRFRAWARRWGRRAADERNLSPQEREELWRWLDRLPEQSGAKGYTQLLVGLVRGRERPDG